MSGVFGALWPIAQAMGRALLGRPKLMVRIEEVRAVATLPDGTSPLPHPVLLLRVFLVNKRHHAIMVKDCRLEVRRFAKVYGAKRLLMDADEIATLSPQRTLEYAVGSGMLDYGRPFEGWLSFSVPKLLFTELRPRERLVLTIVDSFGGRHRFGRWTSSQIKIK